MERILNTLFEAQNLTFEDARCLVSSFLDSSLDPVLATAALVALKMKGETPREITGAAQAMLEKAQIFQTDPLETLDTCGTGGDGFATINISTAAALIAAEAGCPVAKHGNRSVSSKSGSADILESMGLPLDPSPEHQLKCLQEAGICFLFAPYFHPSVKAIMPIRRTLKTRTLFNILGPLANPARPAFQVLGVYKPELCHPMAQSLKNMDVKRALVVHGSGLDEIALHGPTHIVQVERGTITEWEFHPEDVGFKQCQVDQLRGGSPEENADWLRSLLKGESSPVHRQAVALNAGAGIWMAERAESLQEGVQVAMDILESVRGWRRFEKWVEVARGA